MNLKGILSKLSPAGRLLLFFGIVLLSMGVFMLLGFASVDWIFGINLTLNQSYLEDLGNPNVIPVLKYLQVVTDFAVMIVPSLLAALLYYLPGKKFLHLTTLPKIKSVFLVVFVVLSATPLINFFLDLNQRMQLPSFLKPLEDALKAYEQNAAELTEIFLKTESIPGLILNFLIVALLPAVAEELFFRGALQSLLADMFRNKFTPVILSALLFSAIHMQFYGFVPRFMLGLYFGFLLLWSGSLWLPVAAHFVNNAAAVFFAWYVQKNNLPLNPDSLGTEQGDLIWVASSVVLVTVFSIAIRQNEKANSIL